MENKDIFIKDLKEAIGEDNIKLLINYINKQYHIQYKYIK